MRSLDRRPERIFRLGANDVSPLRRPDRDLLVGLGRDVEPARQSVRAAKGAPTSTRVSVLALTVEPAGSFQLSPESAW